MSALRTRLFKRRGEGGVNNLLAPRFQRKYSVGPLVGYLLQYIPEQANQGKLLLHQRLVNDELEALLLLQHQEQDQPSVCHKSHTFNS